MRNPVRRAVGAPVILAVAVAVAVVVPAPAIAAPRPEELPRTYVYEPGQVCEFPVEQTIYGDGYIRSKDFTDADGNRVRNIQFGKTSTEQYTNVWTGETLTIPGSGVFVNQTFDETGGTLVETSGRQIVTLFGNQDPGGPSMVSYVGHLVWYFDGATFTPEVISFAGISTDICAELS